MDLWELKSFGWRQRGELRPVGVWETKLVKVRAERNLEAGKIWGQSEVWFRRMELGARIEKGGKTWGRRGV